MDDQLEAILGRRLTAEDRAQIQGNREEGLTEERLQRFREENAGLLDQIDPVDDSP